MKLIFQNWIFSLKDINIIIIGFVNNFQENNPKVMFEWGLLLNDFKEVATK